MRVWRLPFTAALLAFNTAVEAAVYGRQAPAPTPIITAPASASFTPVVSTIFIPDARPKPTDSATIGIVSLPPASTASFAQASGAELASGAANETSLIAAASLHPWDADPTVMPDVPITAIFLVLFLVGAATHAWRGHKITRANIPDLRPTLSAVVVAFCVLRVLACGLRIAWAVHSLGNEGLQISEMIVLNIGSVTIFMVSAILAQRLVRHYALVSLSGSSWRLVVFWLSNLLLIIASLSTIAIVVVHSVGTSQFANILVSNGASGDNPMIALTLLRIAVAWLVTLGASYILLVAVVVITARTLPRRGERLGYKLAVFFLGIILLEIGQGFRLGATLFAESAMGRPVFYVTGFTLEALVVLLYALANLDLLFSGGRTDSSTSVRNTTGPRSAPFGFFRNDQHGMPRGAQKPTARRAERGGITIRKSLDISVTRLGKVSRSHIHDIRSPSVASAYSDVSANSDRTFQISEINFPMMSSSRPTAARTSPARQVPSPLEGQTQMARAGSINKPLISRASSISARSRPSPHSPPPLYEPLARPGRLGLRQLEQQLEDYENDMELPEDQRALY